MTQKQNWSEEFDKLFGKDKHNPFTITVPEVKSFIQNTLNRERERWVERIKGMDRIYCEIHGAEDYFVENPHPDCNGKGLYSDIVAKCGFIVATLHHSENEIITTLKEQ